MENNPKAAQSTTKSSLADLSQNISRCEPIELRSSDAILEHLPFEKYRSLQRVAIERPQIPEGSDHIEIITASGSKLQATHRDFIATRLDASKKTWVVKVDIFNETYEQVAPNQYLKKALSDLAPGIALTNNPDVIIRFFTAEGIVEKKSGDCFIARGSTGEVYPVSNQTVESTMEKVL